MWTVLLSLAAWADTCPDLGPAHRVEACPAPVSPVPAQGSCWVAMRFDASGARSDELHSCPDDLRGPTTAALAGWVVAPQGAAPSVAGLLVQYQGSDVTLTPVVAPGGAPWVAPRNSPGQQGGVIGGTRDGVQRIHPSELRGRRTPAPAYPPAARALGFGAIVCRVDLRVQASGAVEAATLESCPTVFDAPIRDTLLTWRYEPWPDAKGARDVAAAVSVTLVP